MFSADFLSPTGGGGSAPPAFGPAARAMSLNGAVLGVLDNTKHNADRFLEVMSRDLQRDYGVADVIVRRKSSITGPVSEDLLADFAESADLLVTGIGDCGSCSASSIIDAMLAEERGLPAAAICTSAFQIGAETVASMRGAKDFAFVVIPHPVATLEAEPLAELARAAVPQVVKILTGS